jgi:hypothetical protein
MSGILLDPIYDAFYPKRFVGEVSRLRRFSERIASSMTEVAFYNEKDGRLAWADAFVRLSNPGAASHLDRVEADSKFFRSFALMWTIILPFFLSEWGETNVVLWLWIPLGIILFVFWVYSSWAEGESEDTLDSNVKKGLGKEDQARLEWRDEEWLKAEDAEAEEDKKRRSRLGRRLWAAWTAFVLVPWLAITPGGSCSRWFGAVYGGLYLLVTVFVIIRYMYLRAKRIKLTYQYAVMTYKWTEQTRGAK